MAAMMTMILLDSDMASRQSLTLSWSHSFLLLLVFVFPSCWLSGPFSLLLW